MKSKINFFRNFLFIPAIKIERCGSKINDLDLDGIIYDLEDSVAESSKDEARSKLISYLKENSSKTLNCVRVNSIRTNFYESDWKAVNEIKPDMVFLPKIESVEEIKDAERRIKDYEISYGKTLDLFVAIETIKGFYNRDAIFSSSKKISVVVLGYEDMSADLGIERPELKETGPLNKMLMDLIISSKMYGIQAIGAVSRKIKENAIDGVREEALYEKKIGLLGKLAVHPLQIKPINEVYDQDKMVAEYKKKLEAFDKLSDGSCVIVNESGEMEDTPSLKLAKRALEKYGN